MGGDYRKTGGARSNTKPVLTGIAAAALAPTRVKPGDLWQLGNHRLLCGDSRDTRQVQRLMQRERARLTITSPPYNIGGRRGMFAAHNLGQSKYLHQSDNLSPAAYFALLRDVTENALAVSDMAIVNVQMLAGNKVALVEYLHQFREDLADIAVWDKGRAQPVMSRNVLNGRFEFLLFLTRRRSKGRTPRTLFTADFRGTVSNVYTAPPQQHNPYHAVHAATFPLHLPLWLMQTFDSAGGAVFDPFLGTGTTLMACEQLGRTCYGMEIEPAYCDLLLRRWEDRTGRCSHVKERQGKRLLT